MDKAKINYIIDCIMGLSFVGVAITGLIIFFFLPSGIQGGGEQQFMNITKHNWSAFHEWAGIIMLLFVIIHLILHWRWILSMTKAILRK